LDDSTEVCLKDLKAIFFIKTLEGCPEHEERKEFSRSGGGWTKVWIEFQCDGEELAGWSASSLWSKSGVFFLPTDTESNIEKIFVPRSSLKRFLIGAAAQSAASQYRGKKPADRTVASDAGPSPAT
jgi:hypothetical protein